MVTGDGMAKLLYVGTRGTDDQTQATFPFLMAKGAIEAGHETGIILMGEATPLIKDSVAAQVHGYGTPPLKELLDFLVERNIRITV
jgi:predicted peroxiredoxin